MGVAQEHVFRKGQHGGDGIVMTLPRQAQARLSEIRSLVDRGTGRPLPPGNGYHRNNHEYGHGTANPENEFRANAQTLGKL